MGLIICIFGPDAAGKTTLSNALRLLLRKRGFKVDCVWIRGTHTIASLMARFLFRFKTLRGNCNPYYGICIPPRLKRLWAVLEFTSALPLLIVRFMLNRIRYDVIIAERCPIDTLAWIVLTLRDFSLLRLLVLRALLAISLRLCRYRIYVYASQRVLKKRLMERGEHNVIPIEAQLAFYDVIARHINALCIDTESMTIMKCVYEILKVLNV